MLFRSVSQSRYLPQWKQAIIEEIENQHKPIIPENIFPLAKRDEKHDTGQVFDWSVERSQYLSSSTNHQVFILRLRDEIITSASLHLVQYVSEVNRQINLELEGILDQIIPSLQNLLKKEELLRYIAAGDTTLEFTIPTWLEILSDIASIDQQHIYEYT